jgi:hypothetical protein
VGQQKRDAIRPAYLKRSRTTVRGKVSAKYLDWRPQSQFTPANACYRADSSPRISLPPAGSHDDLSPHIRTSVVNTPEPSRGQPVRDDTLTLKGIVGAPLQGWGHRSRPEEGSHTAPERPTPRQARPNHPAGPRGPMRISAAVATRALALRRPNPFCVPEQGAETTGPQGADVIEQRRPRAKHYNKGV